MAASQEIPSRSTQPAAPEFRAYRSHELRNYYHCCKLLSLGVVCYTANGVSVQQMSRDCLAAQSMATTRATSAPLFSGVPELRRAGSLTLPKDRSSGSFAQFPALPQPLLGIPALDSEDLELPEPL